MKTGDVLYWVVVDKRTGEPVMRCDSRKEAREYAGPDARICKVVVAK